MNLKIVGKILMSLGFLGFIFSFGTLTEPHCGTEAIILAIASGAVLVAGAVLLAAPKSDSQA